MATREQNVAYERVISAGRYCFVLMPFGMVGGVYDAAIKPAIEAAGLSPLRADDVPGAGYDLLGKIHTLITHASILVAEMSQPNPNVAYELGFARALGKDTILLSQDVASAPADLRGLEMIPYNSTDEGLRTLKASLERTLRTYISSNVALLRDMLEPPTPGSCYIVAQPKTPSKPAGGRFHSPYTGELRTYGDNIGIVGLIRSFGLLFGERLVPELLNARAASPQVFSEPNNLFLIGSRKSNDWTDEFLRDVQSGKPPDWKLPTREDEQPVGDYEVVLQGFYRDELWIRPEEPATSLMSEDYGIIVRGPHPRSHEKMVTILAGPHSIGTGAACLAATTSTLIETIQQKLPVALADKSRTIWVLVHGTGDRLDRHISPEGVTVVDAGVYEADGCPVGEKR